MLFNSYGFIGAYLPIVLVGYVLLARYGSDRTAQVWLVACSFFFYSWWNPHHLPVLLASCAGNFVLGKKLIAGAHSPSGRRSLLAIGIGANLALLAYFKYSAFIVANVGALSGIDFAIQAMVLPLGISFFTFQQIAYLADASKGEVDEHDFFDYALFVAFFPQLIAGPIVHHREMMSQFARPVAERIGAASFAMGTTFFAAGLFKKVVIADNLAPIADEAFANAAVGAAQFALTAWHGAMAYTLQLYFDFSGYSDMAIGLALLFGIRLPFNFNSPYQAVNIIDFWRRWHMTLSRFLRDYLYVPLGGNRRGLPRRYGNLLLTMVLGGLWHGAGWNFVIWGSLHGLFLVANHAWHHVRERFGFAGSFGSLGVWVARAVTLLVVTVAWVFFRAPDTTAAFSMLTAMAGEHGWVAGNPVERLSAEIELGGLTDIVSQWLSDLSVPLFLLAACLLPNTQEIVLGLGRTARGFTIRWKPTPAWAAGVAVCLLFSMSQLSRVSAFLYFQF